jgi:4,5-DOPA dioxygenase extradiol
MSKLPAIFISHGAPDLPLRPSATRDFLIQLGRQLERPQAIVVISAHWNTTQPLVSAAIQPETIHDFGGFPAELYRLQYPAPGAPQLAARIDDLLRESGFESEVVTNRGLDHGAWEPLMLMYPDADIPVLQLSIQPHQDPAYHLRLGASIESLRSAGVLILASGTTTHNLWELGGYRDEDPPPVWVADFADWLEQKVIAEDRAALIDYQRQAPYAKRNHPTPEHLLPLFVAIGAGGESAKVTQLHSGYSYGILNMSAFSFE